jgi:1-acyl-sn-glycerol-3-phosphate acyltransferase
MEFFHRQFRRIRRLGRFAMVLLRARGQFARIEGSEPVLTFARVGVLHETCRRSLAALDIQVEVEGTPPTSGLLVSNHLSYLDILIYSSVVPCAFVSKAEVGHWPVIGQYAINGGTIFVERGQLSSSRHGNQAIVEYLKAGVPVVLFPEGTTSDGAKVLRFHSSMLQPAIDAGVTVTPCAVQYEVSDGTERDVAWWGEMTLAPHVLKLTGRRSVRAKVSFGEPLTPTRSRKALSDEARVRVVELRSNLRVS